MTIKAYAIAKHDDHILCTTKNKEYAILKITYQKLFPEGLITYIDDEGNLRRESSRYFNFITK